MSSMNVQKGQQYCCAGGDSTVWQVLTVAADPSGIPHARLFNVERPYEFKTLTCSLLSLPRVSASTSEEPWTSVLMMIGSSLTPPSLICC